MAGLRISNGFTDQARGGAEQAGAEPIIVDTVRFPGLLASAGPDFEVAERDDEDKYPRHVWITGALPKGPTGKIVKRDIVIPADLTAPNMPGPSAAAP